MDQASSRVTAPTNPEPRWPEGYVAVLREAGAKEIAIPFCVAWVRRFFARFPGRRRRDLVRSEIETYLFEIAARPGVSNWMVQEARDALELYHAKFRGIAIAPRPSGVLNHPHPSGRPPPPKPSRPASVLRPPVNISSGTAKYPIAVRGVNAKILQLAADGPNPKRLQGTLLIVR